MEPGIATYENALSADKAAPRTIYKPGSLRDAPRPSLAATARTKLAATAAHEYIVAVQNGLGGAGNGKHTTSRMHHAAVCIQKYARGMLVRAWAELQRQEQRLRELAHLTEFSARELLTLAASCMAPLLDAASDIFVMVSWANSSQEYQQLLWASLGIHFFAGTASGLLFTVLNAKKNKVVKTNYEEAPSTWGHSSNLCTGLLMGWAGLIAPVQAYEAVVDARSNSAISDVLARDDFKHLRWIKTIELMLEHVPQLCLQTFVGIAHGDLDPKQENFSVILMFSVVSGLTMPGLTLFQLESKTRNEKRREVRMAHKGGEITHKDFDQITLWQAYAVCTTLWRSSCITAMTLWLALSICAFSWSGLWVVPVIVAPFAISVHEAAFSRSNRDAAGKSLRSEGGWNGLLFAGFLDSVLIIVMGGLAAIFYTQSHVENMFDTAGSEAGHTGFRNSSCAETTWMMTAAWLTIFLTLALTPVTLALDPEHGITAAARQLQQGPDHTLADEEILHSWLDEQPPKGHRGTM